MGRNKHFTDEQRVELLSNPYTARVSNCHVTFTLAFKEFVVNNINTPGMTAAKLFKLAGYSRDILSVRSMQYTISIILKEAASPEGLKEPKVVQKTTSRKKHSEVEFKELQERVTILEQQIDFLKKSQFLKRQKNSTPPSSSG